MTVAGTNLPMNVADNINTWEKLPEARRRMESAERYMERPRHTVSYLEEVQAGMGELYEFEKKHHERVDDKKPK